MDFVLIHVILTHSKKDNRVFIWKKYCQTGHTSAAFALATSKFGKTCLRLCPLLFNFSPNDSPWKTIKNVFFHLKISFCSLRYPKFCISVFPYFFHASDWIRGWSKINLTVCNLMNCLNKNLKTSCLISWEEKKAWYWNFAHTLKY